MQAACLRAKLAVLDEWNARCREIATQYSTLLAGVDIDLPLIAEYTESVWCRYVIRSKHRDTLMAHLDQRSNYGRSLSYPSHRQACCRDFEWHNLSVAVMLAKEVLCLPMPSCLEAREIEHVRKHVLGFHRPLSF